MNAVEGQDEEVTVASHLQGGILVNIKSAVKASVANLKKRCYERQGMIVAAESRVGRGALKCECAAPCGYRYFPGVFRLRDLQMSDIEKLLRRVYTPEQIDRISAELQERTKMNDRMRSAGVLRRADMMFMGKVPGVLVRGLCHDFPDDFSTRDGGTVELQHDNLEKYLSVFFVNKEHRVKVGA